MGTFSVPIQVGDGQQFVEVETLVDTGASDTTLPENMLTQLGVQPMARRSFRLADERLVEYPVGQARAPNLSGQQFVEVETLVDTGASDTTLPDMLTQLGVQPMARRSFRLADERLVEYPVGQPVCGWMGRIHRVGCVCSRGHSASPGSHDP